MGVGEIVFKFYTDKAKEKIYAEYQEMEIELAERLGRIGIISDGFTPATRFFHYAYADPNNRAICDIQECSAEVSGRQIIPCASCLSDLSVIIKYGSPNAFGFGIGRDFSEYGGAHQADEFVECDKLLEYAKIIALYVLKSL